MENIFNNKISSVVAAFAIESPIILKNDRIINIGSIIKNGAVAETKTYQMNIDPCTESGFYGNEFGVRRLSNGQPCETNKTFKVMVRRISQLTISNLTINPALISPKVNI